MAPMISRSGSVAAQGDHRIDQRGAPGGQQACHEGDGEQARAEAGEGAWVGGGDAVEAARHQAREGQRAGHADGQAGGARPQALPHHPPTAPARAGPRRGGRGAHCPTATSPGGGAKGGGRSPTASTPENREVLAPIPSPSVSTTTAVKPGLRRKPRTAKRTSCQNVAITPAIHP